jgi:hypothetical protein
VPFSLNFFVKCLETQKLILEIGNAIYWVIEPYSATTMWIRSLPAQAYYKKYKWQKIKPCKIGPLLKEREFLLRLT